jgi:hypothetical protein
MELQFHPDPAAARQLLNPSFTQAASHLMGRNDPGLKWLGYAVRLLHCLVGYTDCRYPRQFQCNIIIIIILLRSKNHEATNKKISAFCDWEQMCV